VRIVVDGRPVEIQAGESLLVSLLRAGLHPTGGGCLCLGGDCPHCLVTLDGVSYVRSCQVTPKPGAVVERHHRSGAVPPLLQVAEAEPPAQQAAVPALHLHCDVAVIGQGEAGRAAADEARAAGKEMVTLEALDGSDVAGIYPGPMVVARTDEGTLQVHVRDEVVVATGAAEIQPVAPGNELDGLVTARAATGLAAAGIDLGQVVALGDPPEGVEAELVEGELLRFEGEGRVEAVVVIAADGSERRYACDTVSLGLGLHPRDALVRMGNGLRVRAVGDAARPSDIPPCPRAGTICPCGGVEVADLESVWERGFRELELVKRATLAGTGTCQGSACLPHVRSFLQEKGRELQPPFTARPVTRQLTLGEIASGAYHHPTPRTPLHAEHERMGAQMERSGGWWRPWSYGDSREEHAAVREGASIGDVSTLGKFLVSGPDALAFLERLYPTKVSTLRIGRSRYVLLLDERGYVLDDGLICRDAETRYTLSLTSAGSTFGELWLRDWADALGHDVRILNQTMSLGAVNVTGPLAAELLAAAGVEKLPGFARHNRGRVAGIDCRIFRLSFTGELSYELHHAAADSVTLWRRLMEIGAERGIKPHGLETLLNLRLEKGHIVVGQDTDYDSTPRRIHHEWAVKLDKDEFVGRQAVERTNRVELDRQLVGLEMELPAPLEGEVIWQGERWVGNVTSSADSRVLGRAVMLAWLDFVDGELPEEVTIDGRPARRVPLPFYDSESERARARVRFEATEGLAPEAWGAAASDEPNRLERIEAVHVMASPEALDSAEWGGDRSALRIAPDELLLLGTEDDPPTAAEAEVAVGDPHAIVERETGFSGAWVPAAEAEELLARTCAWELPEARPAFAQGAVAEVPVKILFEEQRALFVVQTPWAHELEDRLW
jgi:glycine cleavage system aminomethyltransferase T